MGKKILGISASYRRNGNSAQMLQAFLKGAADAGAETELIYLADCSMHFCTGCWHCRDTGECVFNDDIKMIAEKIIAADTIVLASPIYFYAVSGQLKTMIDRMDAYYTKIKDKDFYELYACADSDQACIDTAVLEVRGFISCLQNCHELGIVRGTDACDISDIQKGAHLNEAYLMGTSAGRCIDVQ